MQVGVCLSVCLRLLKQVLDTAVVALSVGCAEEDDLVWSRASRIVFDVVGNGKVDLFSDFGGLYLFLAQFFNSFFIFCFFPLFLFLPFFLCLPFLCLLFLGCCFWLKRWFWGGSSSRGCGGVGMMNTGQLPLRQGLPSGALELRVLIWI